MKNNVTKKRILDTMCALIAQQGYDRTSLGQIGDTIGIKKASIYYHFNSKEDIFLQLVSELYKKEPLQNPLLFIDNVDALTFQKELIRLGEEQINSYFENPAIRKVFAEVELQATRIPALKEMIDVSNTQLHHFLFRCMTHGMTINVFPSNFNAKANAQLLFTLLVGIDAAILYDLPIEPKSVWNEAVSKLFI